MAWPTAFGGTLGFLVFALVSSLGTLKVLGAAIGGVVAALVVFSLKTD